MKTIHWLHNSDFSIFAVATKIHRYQYIIPYAPKYYQIIVKQQIITRSRIILQAKNYYINSLSLYMFEDGVSLWILVVYSISFRIDGLGFFYGEAFDRKKKDFKNFLGEAPIKSRKGISVSKIRHFARY